MQDELTLEDLVNQSGLSTRTIRFYIQEGLLPGPDSRGKFARYSQQHLDRLEMIKNLKKLHLPLYDIRRMLNSMTAREMDQIRQQTEIPDSQAFTETNFGKLPESAAGVRALAYIQNLTQTRENIPHLSEAQERFPAAPRQSNSRRILREENQKHSDENGKAETWRRIVLREGFELHIREDMDFQQEIEVKKMIEMIRQLLNNEPK